MSSPADLSSWDQYIELADGSPWYIGRPDNQISLHTIAHSLSGLGRFSGQARRINGNIYTVAEHSVKVSYLVPTRTGLLHDAGECIVNDVAKPVKVFVGGSFEDLEQEVDSQLAEQYGLLYPKPASVKHADIIMVMIEAFDLMPSQGLNWGYYQEYREEMYALYRTAPELRPECWPPDEARRRFIERFEILGD